MIKQLLIILLFLYSGLIQGCASLPPRPDLLATVEGEPVTKGDLAYLLEIAHRREDLSSARPLSISDYLQKIIDEKLIIQEARRMGLENNRDVQQKLEAFILRESVVRLYKEEVGDKLAVGEDEIRLAYKNDHEQFILGIIEISSEEEASAVMKQLQEGGNFSGIASKYSQHVSKKDGGVVTYIRKSLGPFWENALTAMKPGDLSDIRKSGDKFYIVKFIERKEAPDSEFESARKGIAENLRRKKLKGRSDEYLLYLREQEAPKIDHELLKAIKFEGGEKGKNAWLKDERPLVEMRDFVLTAGAFTAMLPSDEDRVKEAVLKQWLDKELVDRAARSRHYEAQDELKESARRYQEQIMKNTFVANTLVRQINISDKEIKEYYDNHKDEFLRPVQYRTQQITANTREEAQDIMNSLNSGANFSWLAKEKSVDSAAVEGGNTGWQMKDQLPEPAREIIDAMNPGDVSPVLQSDSVFKIIRLIEKSGKAAEDFEKVQSGIRMKIFGKKYGELFTAYVNTLKKDAEIIIYEDAVRAFERQFTGRSHGTEKN